MSWVNQHSYLVLRVCAVRGERIEHPYLINLGISLMTRISFKVWWLNQWEIIIKWMTPVKYNLKMISKITWISIHGMKWMDSTHHQQTLIQTINFNAYTLILKIINHIKIRDQSKNLIWNKTWHLEIWQILVLLWKDREIRSGCHLYKQFKKNQKR